MDGVGTSIIGRPRRLPSDRRAASRYTLNCEEPDKAWLSFPEARHGLPVGLSLLSRLVPARLAGQLLATGDRILAQRLSTLGVVDHLVDSGRLDEVAADVVAGLVDLPAAMSEWLFSTPQRVEREQAYLAEVRAAAGAGAWRR